MARKKELNKILEEIKKSEESTSTECSFGGITYQIKKMITMDEFITMVNRVTNYCFSDENEYLPELFQYALRICTFEYFTDIVLPKGIEDTYKVIYNEKIYTDILSNISESQFASIHDAINEKIRYRISISMSDARQQADSIMSELSEVQKQMSALTAQIDPEELAKALKLIANTRMDEEKLMKAYLETKEQ